MKWLVVILLLAAGIGVCAADARLSSEALFLQGPSAAGARASSQVINSVPHYPGTPGDYRLAVWMRDALQGFGLRSWIEPFSATVYTPRILQLQLLTSPVVTFDLHDRPISADPDGSRPGIGIPFNAGSGNGDVRAPVVTVGRGLEANYASLASAGVHVSGRIALVRYGAEYRGNLAARAEQHGAAGVIFYSDSEGRGASRGTVYPNGPFHPPGIVQRGDVMGDDHRPLRIPTLPVTAITAGRLIADMRGSPMTHALVRLHVEMNARTTTLWNTVGEVTGSDPQQIVVLGAHRDAWVYGVTDDGSGIATLLEVARGLGNLHRTGWTPKRSIRIAGWDAEEIGELGSQAYVAAHRSELQRGGVGYLNVDESASGPTFGAAGAGALLPVLTAVAQNVMRVSNPKVDAPAGGSDFESFIYSVGTPVADLGYSGPFGTYHSPYDDLHFASTFADPGFVHHRAAAQGVGVLAMRIAESGAGAYRFAPYAGVLDDGLAAMTKVAERSGLTLAPELGTAIARFDRSARAYDALPARDSKESLRAVQQLDLLAYSANGYASVAFPHVAAALASGNQPRVDAAVASTSATLNNVSMLLEESHAPPGGIKLPATAGPSAKFR
ncbi:MAG TPA: M28 family peptidase [Candidatus Cybelea sp.]|jgi:N-acetylated-alpha-linked acidic dipeptidase|nr:M28 family peptidase [Candidatus Cybelea sp.]